ncbi:hypothetical protein B6D60_00555, partial [candidate division KSB1 bacterium 4484_87]
MEKISILMIYNDKLAYDDAQFDQSIRSLIDQNYDNWELILIDERGQNSSYPEVTKADKIIHLPLDFKNRAHSINRGLAKCNGAFVAIVNNEQSQITFRLSSLELFLHVAKRHDDTGMVYADYRLIEADGSEKDIHLLNYHTGRLRDNMDFGAVWFFPKKVLDQIKGMDESYQATHWYDLRLRASENHSIYHIEAKQNGHLYFTKAPAKTHNVFDYLLAGKDVQLEMEKAVTEHLKRTGAYLAPGQNYN